MPHSPRFRGESQELRVTETVFVPQYEACEIWKVTIENLGVIPRRVSLFAYALFQLTGKTAEGRSFRFGRIIPLASCRIFAVF